MLLGCESKSNKQILNASLANPIENVSSSKDFEKIGIVLEAPLNSINISYTTIGNTTAQIDFTLDNVNYNLRASSLDKNISGIYEKVTRSEQFFIKDQIEVIIDTTTSNTKVVKWQCNNLTYSLSTQDEVANDVLLNIVGELCI